MATTERHAPGTFCWYELGTTNQQAAKTFYSSLLGWTAADSPMGPDEVYTIFSLGGRWAADGRVVAGGAWDPHPVSIHVHGTRGALRIFPYAHHLFLSNAQGMTEVALEGTPMPGNFTAQLESFACCIRERREPEVAGEDGVRALAVVLAAYRGAAERRFVDPREMA